MNTSAPPPFLGLPQTIDTGHPDAVLLHAPFDVAQFHAGLFEAHNVSLPDRLSAAVDKRKADYLAGRALLNHAFAALGRPAQKVPNGEDRAPIWPDGVSGSISHNRTTCACILSTNPSLQIGVDVEARITPKNIEAVRKFSLTQPERALIKDHPQELHLAGLIFSAKETLFKALYPTVQAFFGFECAEMGALPEGGRIALRLTKSLHPTLPEGTIFNISFLEQPDQILTWLICHS